MNGKQSTFLDYSRAFAAQLVLINHIIGSFEGAPLLNLGNFGVVIFFVLSGFLICFTTLDKKSKNPDYGFRLFFVDRFFRIFTPYLPCLIFILILDYILIQASRPHEFPQYVSAKQFIANLFMLQQHPLGLFADKALGMTQFKLATFGSGRPLWTVATEWWIYLTFGWIVLRRDVLKSHWLKFFGILGLIGMVPFFNMVAGTGEGMTLIWFVSAGLAYLYFEYTRNKFGSSASDYIRQHSMLVWGTLLLIVGLLVLRISWVSLIQNGFVWRPFVFYDFSFAFLFILGFALIFFWMSTENQGKRSPLAKFIADYSYSLYLIHYPILHFMTGFNFNLGDLIMTSFLYFLICNIAGIAFWWAFERHYPTLKRAWLDRSFAGGS